MRCDTPEWAAYAAYCGLWIAVYTVGFPVMMAVFLKRNAGHIKEHHEDVLDPFYKEVRELTMAYPNPNGTLDYQPNGRPGSFGTTINLRTTIGKVSYANVTGMLD